MIFLTSWCSSDVGNWWFFSHHDAALMLGIFIVFFVFLISWSISDDGNVLLCPWASSAVLWMCLIDFLSKKHCCARCIVLFSHHETILMIGIYAFRFPSSHIMMQLWCWVLSFFFCVSHIMWHFWCWEYSAVPLGQLCCVVQIHSIDWFLVQKALLC